MRRLLLWAAVLACGAGIARATEDEDISPYREMKALARAMQLIRQDYVDEDRADYRDLAHSAMRGMLGELDPHSQFMDPSEFKDMQADTRSEFGGLGVVVGVKNGRLTVISPMEGTPSFRAGLLPGDELLKIDGASTEKMSLGEAVEKLRGEPGHKVTLTIGRKGEAKPLEFTIEREIIKVPSVKGARILPAEHPGDPKIGYVRITQFSEPTARELARALDHLERQGMQALVLDLRFNPGGLLGSAVDVCAEFLPGGQLVVYTEGRSPSARREYRTPSGRKARRTYPVAVLINGGSASGAEIVAGALKDLNRAVLVGETTFGKGSVQSVISLPDGSAVRLTTAHYYTPARQLIHERGVAPQIRSTTTMDQEIALLRARRTEDLPPQEGRDAENSPPPDVQLDRAADALKGLLLLDQPRATAPHATPART